MQQERLFAVILAGGKGSRIEDPDKPLIKLSSTPLIELCLQKIQDKVAQVVLSINHNPEKYIHLNLPLIPDARDSYQGPLIGIYSAMEWIENNVLTESLTDGTPAFYNMNILGRYYRKDYFDE